MSHKSRKLSMKLDTEVIEAFTLFDKDKDGRISKEEISNLISNFGGDLQCPHVQELLSGAQNLGPVDVGQFMNLWKRFKTSVNETEGTEEEIKSAFKDYDIDGDGYITQSEMMQALGKMGFVSNKEEEAHRCLKDMDLDGDGRVSFSEFMIKWRVS
ncbi:CALM [Lepeophtheirus salmonis]|uniref:CALM n=1 Tax=Lepeophtheirus salmonis TaxID=72036 RepID=A0A0K2TYU1_LEPSM|nr:calmodulin-A-like [Lepeophtheirus salmonis]XP_040583188.1 calmodulin-A-like [Lepeophtheirus salmonis]XP_040583189.1 calmodulin-A-like [Lepeophtheirus salmonis]CAB4055727.1 CALM [Lepeophtheirus salmonis]CAF2780068.1 CALM [Lepeophtheirus salmonis]